MTNVKLTQDFKLIEKVMPSAVETIGSTPMVLLDRMTAGLNGRILAKLEFLNPGFSKKDRIARQMIEDAENTGLLNRGQTIVELTSGNTGTGLSIVCAVKGYPFVAVMSKGNSMERARMMRALGAEVILVEQLPESTPGQVSGGDLERVRIRTEEIVQERNAFWANQFLLESNFRAHYLHTGPEMLLQSEGKIDAFCDFVGSGGTFGGCSMALKEYNRSIRCFIVEPASSAVLSGHLSTNPNHKIQGGGYSMTDLKFIKEDTIDGYIQVTDEEAINACRLLASKEGLFTGFSSGANVAAAMKLLKTNLMGKTIAVTLNDSGLKYLSTDLWE